MTLNITNSFGNGAGGVVNFERMAFIYSPLGNICAAVPLDANYAITSAGAVPAAGAITLA